MGFSMQEYWSGFPFPSPGDLPNPGIEPGSPALQADALTSEPPGKPSLDTLEKWQPTPVFLPREAQGWRSLDCCRLWGRTESEDWSDLAIAANSREGTQLHPSTENWIKDLLSMAPTIRIRPSFPLNQALPSGSFHKPLILPSEGRQSENQNHRKLTNLITQTTDLSNSMKLWAMPYGATQDDGSWWRVLTKRGPLEKGMANHFSTLALRTPWTVWKWATVHTVAKSRTGLSIHTGTHLKSRIPLNPNRCFPF